MYSSDEDLTKIGLARATRAHKPAFTEIFERKTETPVNTGNEGYMEIPVDYTTVNGHEFSGRGEDNFSINYSVNCPLL